MIDHGSVVRNGWLVLWAGLEVLYADSRPVTVRADAELEDAEVLELLHADGIHVASVEWNRDTEPRVGALQLTMH